MPFQELIMTAPKGDKFLGKAFFIIRWVFMETTEQRESFVSYRIIHEILKDLNFEQYGRFLYAINEYTLYGNEIKLEGIEKALWVSIKYYIDRFNSKNDRRCPEYKQWRLSVFQRDNYTCQNCGATDKKLNAHHIKRFAKDAANRFNIANGITLCVDCHRELHKREGR